MIYIDISSHARDERRQFEPGTVAFRSIRYGTTAVGVSRIGRLCGLLAVTLGKKA
jgi:hypothetical protein